MSANFWRTPPTPPRGPATISLDAGNAALALLGVVLVWAKLVGYIDWSWWLVLLPFYVGLAIAVVVLGLAGLLIALARGVGKLERKLERQRRERKYAALRERLAEL